MTQNVPSMVTLNPIFKEPNKTYASIKAYRYPQKSNKGVPNKNYEPKPKLIPSTQLATMCASKDCLNGIHLLLINYLLYLFIVVCMKH